ncbi:MAG TPA: hypothetical protein VMH30_10020 [Verrucomicrobiae bacterium]|nr:hypothetical protein [Verrucomicrobiae bacterium]
MKHWAFLTVLIYALALLLLAVPAIVIAFSAKHIFSIKMAATVYHEYGFWLWLAVLVGGQALLLLLPIDIAEKRLPARRHLKVPIIVSGFFFGLLVLAAILCLLSAAYGDRVPGYYDLGYDLGGQDTAIGGFLTGMIVLFLFWLGWMMVFRRATARDEPDTIVKRSTRWLLRGSILELLVAVPSHVIVRRRDDCCAPIFTFWGMATGISVMLLCFGPGVFFLFVERFRRLKPQAAPAVKP